MIYFVSLSVPESGLPNININQNIKNNNNTKTKKFKSGSFTLHSTSLYDLLTSTAHHCLDLYSTVLHSTDPTLLHITNISCKNYLKLY